MKATRFDQKFDAGESVLEHLDLHRADRPGLDIKRVNVDFPQWMVQSIDRQARPLGVTRQSLIKLWLAGSRCAPILDGRAAATIPRMSALMRGRTGM